jgi:hypothetical protein
MSCLMDDVHAYIDGGAPLGSNLGAGDDEWRLPPTSDTSFENFWKQLSFSSVIYGAFNSRKVMIVTGLRRPPSSSVSNRSLLHEAPWCWVHREWQLIFWYQKWLLLPNMLVLYHGFMQPIFVHDLQLTSPVPLDLMLMSFKTLQRRWWVAQPPPYTRTIEIYLLVAWLLKERFNGPANSCKPGIMNELC